jgi:hypothetical protein
MMYVSANEKAVSLNLHRYNAGHPGFNNAFLISTESDEAQRWNEVSVNENGGGGAR